MERSNEIFAKGDVFEPIDMCEDVHGDIVIPSGNFQKELAVLAQACNLMVDFATQFPGDAFYVPLFSNDDSTYLVQDMKAQSDYINDQLYRKCGKIVRFSLEGDDHSNEKWYRARVRVSSTIWKVRTLVCFVACLQFECQAFD